MKPPRIIGLLACFFLLSGQAVPVCAQSDARIISILEKAIAAPEDKVALATRLRELEAELGGRTDVAVGEYARGWIMSHLGRQQESIAAYDRASALNPKLGDAWYNAGVILKEMGRNKEAIEHWKAAIRADPSNVDAAYNIAQFAYDTKDFASALEWFQKVRTLTPEDFSAAKKVLQAQHALALWEDAMVTREEVYRLHRESGDPQVRALKEYCFDQFDVGDLHIFAYETFKPSGEDAALFTFQATRPDSKVWGRVRVVLPGKEPNKAGPCRLEIEVGNGNAVESVQLNELPDYAALKERIRVLTRRHILPIVK